MSQGFSRQLFLSANSQLKATVTLLLEGTPNPKAMDSARMATEIFLKTFIAAHRGLTEQKAKQIGHDLKAALDECLEIRPQSEIGGLTSRITRFPAIGSRYEGMRYELVELWFAYGTAQFAGSALVRSLTDRNTRREIELRLSETGTQQR